MLWFAIRPPKDENYDGDPRVVAEREPAPSNMDFIIEPITVCNYNEKRALVDGYGRVARFIRGSDFAAQIAVFVPAPK